MGPVQSAAVSPITAPPLEQAWSKLVQSRVEAGLGELLELPDEARLDTGWRGALAQLREYALRPARRVRPALLLASYCLARGSTVVPAGLWRFAAGVELLHTCLLAHDDVLDRTALRRGGLALPHQLGRGRLGEDLAVVVGDHLFARAMEALLGSGLAGASGASQYYLRVWRHAAAGRSLELRLASTPLGEVGLWAAKRGACLRTVRYGFCAPLAAGALLAGADAALVRQLERVGRHVGLAWQLREDLVGLFGEPCGMGARVECDFIRGRRSFPVLAAWARARPEVRRELEALWSLPAERKDDAALTRARKLVEESGGRGATERVLGRASRSALRGLSVLPPAHGVKDLLTTLVGELALPHGARGGL